MNNSLKNCKVCGKEIAKRAKVCPYCGAKNRMSTGLAIFLGIMIFLFLCVGLSSGGSSNSSSVSKEDINTTTPIQEYQVVSLTELFEELDNNALRAETKYKDMYVEVSGRISYIDEEGDYINITSDNMWFLSSFTCHIENPDHLKTIINMNDDDYITVRGKIYRVDDLWGYDLTIHDIK